MTTSTDHLLRDAAGAASAAATDPSRWYGVALAICKLTDGLGCSIFQPAVGARPLVANGNMVVRTADYFDHWIHQDPWNAVLHGTDRFAHAGQVLTGEELVPGTELQRLPYYVDHARLVDSGHKLFLKICDADDPAAPTMHLAVSRSFRQAPFGASDVESVRRLWPHLQRSVQMNALLGLRRATAQMASECLAPLPEPAFVVTEAMAIAHANAAGRRLLARAAPLRWRAGRLAGVGTLDEATLAGAVRLAAQGFGSRQVFAEDDPRQPGQFRRGVLRVAPLGPDSPLRAAWPDGAALLLVETHESSDDEDWIDRLVAPRYRLTPAEVQVLRLLVDGADTDAIAARLTVTVNTVRSHVRALRAKTGRRSLVGLVRLGLGR